MSINIDTKNFSIFPSLLVAVAIKIRMLLSAMQWWILIYSLMSCSNIKFLQSPTHTECDSMHSVIWNALWRKSIDVLANYMGYARLARKKQPYYAKYLNFWDFKNFAVVRNLSSLRPGMQYTVNFIVALKYDGIMGAPWFKIWRTNDYRELFGSSYRKNNRCSLPKFVDLPLFYTKKLPITEDKFKYL